MAYDFRLNQNFVEQYKNVKPNFGFNGLGELTYERTYSRKKENGTKERWYETVERVVNGVYSIQKRHIKNFNLGWDEEKAQRSAQEMYDRIFKMKFLPGGRGLWAMGSPIIEERGLYSALMNCSFTSTDDEDRTRPFEFLMDLSMLGVGVGFDTKAENNFYIKKPEGEINFTIPDSREGWVESIRYLLRAYFYGEPYPIFDYSEIRGEGEPIRTFGGISSGPQPLIDAHVRILKILNDNIGNKINQRIIVDIMNIIGVAVVSGNVRRSAEIAIGNNDSEFIELKDFEKNPERGPWAWSSNNSVVARIGDNYKEASEALVKNGEPGFFWIDNARHYGRMADGKQENIDGRVAGVNPCGEQSLEDKECCNLVENFLNNCDNIEDFKRTLKFSYLFAKTVTLGSHHWVESNRVMLRNRRIGTSLAGVASFVDNYGLSELYDYCNEGYDTLKYYDKVYSDWLCIPRSIKLTSIKPGGTTTLLAGETPGMSYPEGEHYIRRMRLPKNGTLWKLCEEAGFDVEDDANGSNSFVVSFPIKISGVRGNGKVSMWEQLNLASFLQRYWSDNQVSATIVYDPSKEAEQIKYALEHFQFSLKSISFLPKIPKGAYAQMPQEEITSTEYHDMASKINPINFENYRTDAKPTMFCDNESCDL